MTFFVLWNRKIDVLLMKLNNLCSKEVRKSYLNLFKYVGVLICLWRSPKGKLQQLLARLHIVSGFRLKMKNLEISLKISDNGKCFWLNLLSRHHGLSLARLGFQDLLSFMRIHLERQVWLALIFACPPVLPRFFKKKTTIYTAMDAHCSVQTLLLPCYPVHKCAGLLYFIGWAWGMGMMSKQKLGHNLCGCLWCLEMYFSFQFCKLLLEM